MSDLYRKIRENRYGLLKIPSFSDSRGSLSISESQNLPFEIKRVFWIYDVGEGKTRGGHAHSTCQEIVFAINGSFDIFIDNGKEQQTFHIDKPDTGIYIGANVWCELSNFSEGTVCVALASEPYNSKGYINDKDEFNKVFSK